MSFRCSIFSLLKGRFLGIIFKWYKCSVVLRDLQRGNSIYTSVRALAYYCLPRFTFWTHWHYVLFKNSTTMITRWYWRWNDFTLRRPRFTIFPTTQQFAFAVGTTNVLNLIALKATVFVTKHYWAVSGQKFMTTFLAKKASCDCHNVCSLLVGLYTPLCTEGCTLARTLMPAT